MSVRVRPLSFLGSYPNVDVAVADDMLLRSGRALFCCTKNRIVEVCGRIGPDQPAFELDNWTIQEVRFLSSIYVGNGEASSVRLYPLPIYRDLEIESVEVVMEDGHLLKPLLEASLSDTYFMAGNHGLLPDHIDQYKRIDWDDRLLRHATTFWNDLDVDDAVVIRGLHALLKSEMLFEHFQFRDASLALSHIALDAAHSIVLRRLRQAGHSSPSSIDAQSYLEDIFGVPKTGMRFFEDYYEDRVRNFHTDSRYGAESIPFFSIDDVWHLNAALKGVFFALVTGQLHDETRENRDGYLRHAGIACPNDLGS